MDCQDNASLPTLKTMKNWLYHTKLVNHSQDSRHHYWATFVITISPIYYGSYRCKFFTVIIKLQNIAT